MSTRRSLLIASLFGLSLAACNSTPSEPLVALAAVPAGDQNASGTGPCGAQIAAYRRVMDSDVETGHVNRSVYDRVIPEVERAAAACRAGQDGPARAQLAATKAKFGYR